MASQVALEDSNIALLGSAEDIAARVAAAKTEDQWTGAGSKPGIEVWRVYNFSVNKVPEDHVGVFHEGDSYIVLYTYPGPGDTLGHRIHFWLGLETTADEAGTAAYKTVELDDLLGRAPIQYREVQGRESDVFLGYFDDISILPGGYDSAFTKGKHWMQELHESGSKALIMIKGRNNVQKRVVPLSVTSLNAGDVFLLDTGAKIYKWIGKSANPVEKYKASTVVTKMDDDRRGTTEIIELNQGEESEEFWEAIGGKGEIAPATDDREFERTNQRQKSLWRLRVEDGHPCFKKVADNTFSKSDLQSDDVFIIDTETKLVIWVGAQSNVDERKKAMFYAQEYLRSRNRAPCTPIERVAEGVESATFDLIFTM